MNVLNGRFDEGYVPHDDVPLYFAAADVVVLPFRKVTTSGSALLALSLGRPVVAPRLGALRDPAGERRLPLRERRVARRARPGTQGTASGSSPLGPQLPERMP